MMSLFDAFPGFFTRARCPGGGNNFEKSTLLTAIEIATNKPDVDNVSFSFLKNAISRDLSRTSI